MREETDHGWMEPCKESFPSECGLDSDNWLKETENSFLEIGSWLRPEKNDFALSSKFEEVEDSEPNKVTTKAEIAKGCEAEHQKIKISGKAEENNHKIAISMQAIERLVLEKISVRCYRDKYFCYNSRCWEPITKNELLLQMRSVLPTEVVEAIDHIRIYKETAEYMKMNPQLQIGDAEMQSVEHKTYISCNNCVVDAGTLKIYDHSPDYLLFFSCNFEYKENPGDTPAWNEFLNCVAQGDSHVITLVKEMIGYLMLHSNDAKAFFVMGTAPDSGKTVLGQWIAKLFNSKNIAHIPLQEMGDRFALSRASNIALNICMDISAKKVPDNAVGVMKQITGESELLIEQKYQQNEDIRHHFHCLFGTNADITLARPDDAFFNRMVYLPFVKSIPRYEQDKHLLEKLISETDDFASKCVCAVHDVIQRNYLFTETQVGQRVAYAWSGNVTPVVVQVISECFEFSYDVNDVLSTRKCYDAYSEKCVERGYNKISYEQFKSYMQNSRGLTQKRLRIDGSTNAISCLVGVRFKVRDEMLIPVRRI